MSKKERSHGKIMERKLFERGMLATPSNEITLPSSHSKTQTTTTSKKCPIIYYSVDGFPFNNDSNQDSDREWRSPKMQGLRKLLWKPNKPGKFAAKRNVQLSLGIAIMKITSM
ncbi:hypothetical protein CEXT_174291 [Caerostris extrusa]|uniref:Uncharacterized protein n=1 Tax=Caerostris extrusa TaxID=172846 RepID=A0AAV4SAN1_CAEEX|nr:hypothetical protein CEXT_174291 [Caerostris extrusa]